MSLDPTFRVFEDQVRFSRFPITAGNGVSV
jgi:hypothetical protein